MRSIRASFLIHAGLVLLVLAIGRTIPSPPEEVPVEIRILRTQGPPSTPARQPRPMSARQTVKSTPSPESISPADSSTGATGSSASSLTGASSALEEYEVSELPALMNEVRIPYPPEARVKRLQGAVIFDLVISSSGEVSSYRVVQSPGPELSEAASNAIRKFRFRPAKKGDQPVAIRIRYTYRFMIE